MNRIAIAAAFVAALALAGTAAAALEPWTFVGTGVTCPVVSTYGNGVLHLEKNCSTETVAAAGASITGMEGQTFSSGSFTLASPSQCQGGSPRFNVFTSTGTFFLGCNNVAPTTNANGTATYTFTAATLAAAGQQVPTPTGTISGAQVLIDVQGTADLTNITFNGVTQVPAAPVVDKNACKNGGWKTMTNPSFRNQGQCVSHFNHALGHGHGKGGSKHK